jgi:hypothetical protein
MERFYSSENACKALMHRNKLTFPWRAGAISPAVCGSRVCRFCRQQRTLLQLFQMDGGIDKIARRDVNRGSKRLFGLTYH